MTHDKAYFQLSKGLGSSLRLNGLRDSWEKFGNSKSKRKIDLYYEKKIG